MTTPYADLRPSELMILLRIAWHSAQGPDEGAAARQGCTVSNRVLGGAEALPAGSPGRLRRWQVSRIVRELQRRGYVRAEGHGSARRLLISPDCGMGAAVSGTAPAQTAARTPQLHRGRERPAPPALARAQPAPGAAAPPRPALPELTYERDEEQLLERTPAQDRAPQHRPQDEDLAELILQDE